MYHPQVVANTTTSVVTFSILSPDASLSYDRIKLRLEEYRTLLASNSDSIELPTENGKSVICQKQANEMELFLDQAETLLRGIAQSHDISTLVILHRLRDLAEVLDSLKLYDECRLTGNCALDLAEALGRQSLEFKHEQAETLALLAGLTVYQPRARTLFIQAVSICEKAVENDASDSNKTRLLIVLDRAGYWSKDHPDLHAQWLEHAVQLMTKELPSTMVPSPLCGTIYNNYGVCLQGLKQHANAVEVLHKAITIRHTLVTENPVKYTSYLAGTIMNMTISLHTLGKYDGAIAAYEEALVLCRSVSTRDPLQYDRLLAKILYNYGISLRDSNRVSEAAEAFKESVLLYRNLTQAKAGYMTWLCYTLYYHGWSRHLLGQHAEAVLSYQESIPLWNALGARDPGRTISLKMKVLHNMANSLHALGQEAEADAAANETLQMNQGNVLGDCIYAPDYGMCFVCQRAIVCGPQICTSTPPPALPSSSTSSLAMSGEHSESGTSVSPAMTTTSHTPHTYTLGSSELGQPDMAPDHPDHLESIGLLPSRHPQIQELTDSSAHPPKSTRGMVNVSQQRKRDNILGVFKRNRAA